MSKSSIDTGNIYCFGTGLPISMSKDIYQYHHLMSSYKFSLQIFGMSHKSKEL